MRSTIKINQESGLAYISEMIRKEGYKGEVNCLRNAITLVLIRPGASLKDVKRSLLNVVQDISMKLKYPDEEALD